MSQAQDDLVAAASNPNTDLTKLHELANNYPGLRPYIATNPRTYPALLEWLGTLGDPAVDAALARRYGPAQPLTTAPADGSTQILAPGQVGAQSPKSPPQQQSLAETQRQQPVQPEYAQPTQTIQQTQYQQPARPEYAQPTQTVQQTQYQQPVRPEYAQAAQQAPDGVFGVGEVAEEEAGPRPTLWLWILGAVAIVAVVAVVVWFVLSNHGGGDDAAGEEPAPTAAQTEAPKSGSPSTKPSPSASATPSPSATPSQRITAPAPANAIEMSSFTAPSGNITCTLAEDSVTCTIKEHNFTPSDASCKNSANSPVTWTVKKDGNATSSCGGSFAGSGAQLQYGSAAKNSSFACTSSENGIECWSQITGQGFTMSRDSSQGTNKSG